MTTETIEARAYCQYAASNPEHDSRNCRQCGVLEVAVVGVGAWQAESAIDILGMCRAKLRLPGRSYHELEADLARCGR